MSSINHIVLLALMSSVDGQTKSWSLNPITTLTTPRVSASENYMSVVTIDSEGITAASSKIGNNLTLKVEIWRENGTLMNECAVPVRVLNKFGLIVFLQLTMLSDDRAALTWIDNNPMIQYAPAYLSLWLLDTLSCEHTNVQIDVRSDDGYVLGSDKYFSLVPYADQFDVFFPNEALCPGGACRLTLGNDGKIIGELASLNVHGLPALWQVASISATSPSEGHVLYRKNHRLFETLLLDAQGKAVKSVSFDTGTSPTSSSYFSVCEPRAGILGYCFLQTPRRLNCTLIDPNLNVIMQRLMTFDLDVLYVKMHPRQHGFLALTLTKAQDVYTIWKTVALTNGYVSNTTAITNLHECDFSKFDVFTMSKSRCVLATCAHPRPNTKLLKDYHLRATCF